MLTISSCKSKIWFENYKVALKVCYLSKVWFKCSLQVWEFSKVWLKIWISSKKFWFKKAILKEVLRKFLKYVPLIKNTVFKVLIDFLKFRDETSFKEGRL